MIPRNIPLFDGKKPRAIRVRCCIPKWFFFNSHGLIRISIADNLSQLKNPVKYTNANAEGNEKLFSALSSSSLSVQKTAFVSIRLLYCEAFYSDR